MCRLSLLLCILAVVSCGGSGGGGNSAYAAEPETVSNSQQIVAGADAEQKDYEHIIILGDSIMYGSAAGPGTTAAHLLAQNHGVYVSNLSKSRQTLAEAVRLKLWNVVEFLARKRDAEDAALFSNALVIQLGHNDWFLLDADAASLRSDYKTLLDHVQGLHVDPYCVVPVKSRWDSTHRLNQAGLEYGELREVVRELAAEGLCSLVDTSDWYTDADVYDGYTMPDGLHFGARGHLIYSNRLMAALE